MSQKTSTIQKAIAKARKQVGIPPVPGDLPPHHRGFFQALRENLAVRMGQEGDPLQQAVVFKDLLDNGMAKWADPVRLGGKVQVTPPSGDTIGFDYSAPAAPTNLVASGGFNIIYLTWDIPEFDYSYHTEVWRSPTDALDLTDPDMKLVGTANAGQFVDDLNGDRTVYYYWIRFVKTIGTRIVNGAFNQTAGTSGQIPLTPDSVMQVIREASDVVYFTNDGQSNLNFDPNTDYTDEATLRGTKFVMGYATVAGQTRFIFNVPAYIPDAFITNAMIGSAVIDNVKIKDATIKGAKMDLATVWELEIGDEIKSSNYTAGSAGWRVTNAGAAEFSGVTVRGKVEAEEGNIASTLTIGGSTTTMQDVLDIEASVTDWTKPTTTLIDGNKIYTGDAYVDTLQIKGNAVTVPAGARRTSNITISSVNDPPPYVTVTSFTYDHGFSAAIGGMIIGFIRYGKATSTGDAGITIRVLVNGVEVEYGSATAPSSAYSGVLSVSAYVSLPTGSYTVELQAKASSTNTVTAQGSVAVIGGKR